MATSFVDDFCDTDSDESTTDEPKVKRRRVNRVWLFRETFASSDVAEKAVESRKIWKKCSSRTTSSGDRVTYRCTAGRYRENECPAGLYLLYHGTSMEVSLYETNCDHGNHATDPPRGLSADMKEFVKNKFTEGITKIINSIFHVAECYRNVLQLPFFSMKVSQSRTHCFR